MRLLFEYVSALIGLIFLFSPSSLYSQLPGDRDSTFHEDGIVITTLSEVSDGASTVAVLPDGKFLVGGYTDNGEYADFAIVKYLYNGEIDSLFGVDGLQQISPGLYSEFLTKLIPLPDGNIVASGYMQTEAIGATSNFVAAKLSEDGSLIPEFGIDGLVIEDLGYSEQVFLDGVLQDDGKMIFVGNVGSGGSSSFALVRLLPDGTMDSSFDGDGLWIDGFPYGSSGATSVHILDDDKILVAGYAYNMGVKDYRVIRLFEDGSLDESFGDEGELILDLFDMEDHASSMAIQSDGGIVLAGWSGNYPEYDFSSLRLNSDGLDSTWSEDGICITDLGTTNDHVDAIGIDVSGNIVLGGSFLDGGYKMALVRYLSSGVLDSTFNLDGIVDADISFETSEQLNDLVILGDGKILVAGSAGGHFALQRFIGRSQQSCDSIVVHPSDVVTTPGTTINFFITSAELSSPYQWQTDVGFGWTNLSEAGQYTGVNSDTVWVNDVTLVNNNQLFRALLTATDCVDTSLQALLQVEPVVGLNFYDINSGIQLYPNPFDQTCYLRSNDGRPIFVMRLLDITGNIIPESMYQIISGEHNDALYLTLHADLPKGMYQVLLSHHHTIVTLPALKH